MSDLTARYAEAVEYARHAHRGAVRKGTAVPYLAHVVAVSALVLEHGGDEDQAIAALLHDTAEDAGGESRLADISSTFGPRVADLVRACSDSLVHDPAQKAPWWERKVAYLDHVARAPGDALVVMGADQVHNAESLLTDYRELGEGLWSRFNTDAGRSGQLWYQARMAGALGRRLLDVAPSLAARLDEAVDLLIEQVEATVGPDQVQVDLEAATAIEQQTRERLATDVT